MPEPKPDPLLDLEARRRLFQLIQDYPGLHEREAARQLKTSQALVHFHRTILEQHGLVRVERDDRLRRMYAQTARTTPTADERRLLGMMRNRKNLHLVLILLSLGQPVKHGELVEALGIGKSSVSFYLRKLEAAGLVAKNDHGLFALVEPRKVHLVLTKYQPTPDLLEEFTQLWSNLYDM